MNLTSVLNQLNKAVTAQQKPSAEIIEAALALMVDEATFKARCSICAACDQVKIAPPAMTVRCGAPGCLPCSSANGQIIVLARYKEQLPEFGCKHPQRAAGKGWPSENAGATPVAQVVSESKEPTTK